MGFFDVGTPKLKNDIVECIHFTLKYKFDYAISGHDNFYMVDKDDNIYHIWSGYNSFKNIYVYKYSMMGDEIQLIKREKGNEYEQILENITRHPKSKVNITDLYNGVKK